MRQNDLLDVSKVMHRLGFRIHGYDKAEDGTWQTTHYVMTLDKYVLWASFDRPNATSKTHRLVVKIADNGKYVRGAYRLVGENRWQFHTTDKKTEVVMNKGIILASNWKTRMIQVMAQACQACALRDKSKEMKSFSDRLNMAKVFV